MTREDLMDRYPEETFLLADGFDDAISNKEWRNQMAVENASLS